MLSVQFCVISTILCYCYHSAILCYQCNFVLLLSQCNFVLSVQFCVTVITVQFCVISAIFGILLRRRNAIREDLQCFNSAVFLLTLAVFHVSLRMILTQRIFYAPPPRNAETDTLLKMEFQTYILLKMQEMPFQRPKFQKVSGGRHAPGPPRIVSSLWPPPLTKILVTPLFGHRIETL